MNPLLKHTLDELNKPNADPEYVIGMSFISLLEQALENPKINLCGGDAVDENTAKYVRKKSLFDDITQEVNAKTQFNILHRRVISDVELKQLIIDAFKYTVRITCNQQDVSCDIITPPAANIPVKQPMGNGRRPENSTEIPDHLSDYMPDIPPISNVMTCRNRMLQSKRLPNCSEICSLGFDKVPKLKRECEIPDYWF